MKQQKGHLKEQRQADGNGGLKEQRQAGGSGRSSSKNPKREVEMDDDDHHRRRNDKPSMNTSKSIGPARGPPVPEVRKTEKKSSPTQGLSSVKRTVVDLDDDIVDEDVQQQRSPETGVLPQAVDVSTVNKNKPVPQRQGDFLTEQSQDQCNINKGGAFPTSTPAPQTTTMAVLPQACGSAVPIVAMCTRIEPPATQEDYRSNQTRTTTTSVAASSKATSRTPLEKDPVPCASTRRVLILACIVLACIIMLAIGSVLFVVARKNNTKEEGDASNEFHENHARTNDQVLLLESGMALSDQHGLKNEVQLYTIVVPALHSVTCETEGVHGDVDLYLRFHDVPELDFKSSNNACHSVHNRSNEVCTTNSTLSGSEDSLLYVALHAYEAYRDLTLICVVQPLSDTVQIIELHDGVPLHEQHGEEGQIQLYMMPVPSEHTVTCTSIGGNGDVNLFLRFDTHPDTQLVSSNDCHILLSNSDGECTTEPAGNHTGTMIYIALHGQYWNVTLTCTTRSNGASIEANPVEPDLDFGPYTELRNGVSLSNLNGREDDVQIYAMFVPQDHAVTCTTRGNNGDADLFLRFNEPPDLIFFTSNDCESTGFDSNEECTATRPLGSTSSIIYVAVIAFSSYHGLTLTCTTEELISWVEIPPMPDQSETDVCFLKELNALYCTLSSLAFESSGCLQCATMAIGRWNPLGGEGTDNCASLQGDFCVAMTQCGCGACVNEVANFLACTVMMDECDLVCRSQSPGSSPTGTNSQGQVIELGNGVPLQNQNGAQRGDVQIYSLTSIPPEHMVTCTTRGNNGDADLYVRFNQLPDLETSSRNDCTSLGWTSNEECIVGPTTGTANVTLYAAVRAAGTYRNVTITCTCTAHQLQGSNGGIPSSDNSSSTESTGNGEFIELESGIPLLNQHGQTEDLHFYTLSVPPEHMVTCITRGDNGDADLFMYFGEDFIDFDCYSFGSSSNEECIVGPSGDIASTLYVIVSASYTYYDVSITCTAQLYQGNNGGSSSSSTSVPTESTGIGQYIELQDGVPLPNQNGLGGDSQIYTMPVPPDHTVTCMTRGNDGDADLSARFNHDSLFSNGCHSIGLDSNEECTTGPSGSTAGTIYVELFAAVSYQDLTITCRTQPYQGSQTSTGPSAGATGLLTEETAPTGAPTQNSPPDPANVISYTLETHNLLFIFQQSRIPNNQDYEELTQLTEDYLNQFFEQVLQQTNDIIFSGSTTELIDRRFLLGQPVRVTYSTTIILSRMSTLLPSEVELTALLISAFRGAQLALYLTAVQALPATNIFQSTSEIEFVQ